MKTFFQKYSVACFVFFIHQLNAQNLDTSKTFNIVSVGTGKSIDIAAPATNSGAKVIQNTAATGAISQRWKAVNLNNGYYQLINVLSGYALSNGNSVSNAVQLQVDNVQPASIYQQWRITNLGSKYAIVSRNSSKAVDVNGGSWSDYVPIIQWDDDAFNKTNQQWLFNVVSGSTPGSPSQLSQVSNLPCFYITTNNNAPIYSKDEYLKGQLVVVGGSTDSGYYNGAIEIRGRGHSTWGMAKKPYRIKLASKYNLLGMPSKEKVWVLLANYADKSLMRNALAFEMSKYLGFKFTPAYRFADVFINGDYQGNYLITDQVEVGNNRVDVEAQDPLDVAQPAITGGYLLEVDGFAHEEAVWFQTGWGVPVTIKYPKDDVINQQQKNYITNYVKDFENALTGPGFKDSATGYRKYSDMNSMVNYYILSELSGNVDAFWSTNIFKYRNDPKLYYGPVWDYDQAFYNYNQQGDLTYQHVVDYAYEPKVWIKHLIKDDFFNQSVKKRLLPIITNLNNRLQFVADSLSTLLQRSQQLNFTRWPILNYVVFKEPVARGTYANEVQFLKDFISKRFTWLKDQLKDIDTSKSFNIVSVASKKTMEPEARSISNGARIVQNTVVPGAASQLWKAVNLNNGYYRLINVLSGKALNTGNLPSNGIQLQVNIVQPASLDQQWRINNLGGKYEIVNRVSMKAADVNGGSWNDNVAIIQWDNQSIYKTNQQWLFNEIVPAYGKAAVATSTDTTIKAAALSLYPNPARAGNNVLAGVNLTKQSKAMVNIYTSQRILVKSEYKGILPKGKQQVNISVATLQPGAYLVKIITDNQEFSQQLIIH